jgi:hypothetical protein
MADDRLPLAELLQKAGDGDFLRAVAEAVLQLLMEADDVPASRPCRGRTRRKNVLPCSGDHMSGSESRLHRRLAVKKKAASPSS